MASFKVMDNAQLLANRLIVPGKVFSFITAHGPRQMTRWYEYYALPFSEVTATTLVASPIDLPDLPQLTPPKKEFMPSKTDGDNSVASFFFFNSTSL